MVSKRSGVGPHPASCFDKMEPNGGHYLAKLLSLSRQDAPLRTLWAEEMQEVRQNFGLDFLKFADKVEVSGSREKESLCSKDFLILSLV